MELINNETTVYCRNGCIIHCTTIMGIIYVETYLVFLSLGIETPPAPSRMLVQTMIIGSQVGGGGGFFNSL